MGDQTTGLLSQWLIERRIEQAYPYAKGSDIIDLGCGRGELAKKFSVDHYLGVDPDEVCLKDTRRRFPDHRFEERLRAGKRFDTIFMLAVIEHLERPEVCLTELRGLLNPGGRIVLTTPHPVSKMINRIGAATGLLSREAYKDHHELFDRERMERTAKIAGFCVTTYKRFLWGLNQLIVLELIDHR